MIAKEVSYDLAMDEWKALLDGGNLTPAQQRMARAQLAGLRAEKDMAYHLKVFFAEKPEFHVFNNLKVVHGDSCAQIDHLVLSRWTAYFIESKSVSQVITINEHGEWGRIHNRRFTPMDSPVEQSRRHQQVLFDYMTAQREQFMGKLLGVLRVKYFHRLLTPVHFVAISSKGQIWGRGRRRCEEVMKADQVPHAISAYHEELNTGIFSTSTADADLPAFNAKEFSAVVEFLLRNDVAQTPLEYVHQVIDQLDKETSEFAAKERDASEDELKEAPSGQQETARQYACKHCRSQDLVVSHGPYGYYFKCKACERNNAIVELCETCKLKLKITKAGPVLVGVCPGCHGSRSVWDEPGQPLPVPAAAAVAAALPPVQRPICPVCKSEMKLRTARTGKNQGQQFWGCMKYPHCRGIVQK